VMAPLWRKITALVEAATLAENGSSGGSGEDSFR